MKTDIQETNRTNVLFERIAALIEQSRQFVVSAVNVAEVRTRFEVGRFIFEGEQRGERAYENAVIVATPLPQFVCLVLLSRGLTI